MLRYCSATLLATLFLLGSLSVQAASQTEMERTVDFVTETVRLHYAPKEWKRQHFNWDWNAELASAQKKIKSDITGSNKAFHQTLKQLLGSTRDYHVGISFQSTEMAAMGLDIRRAEDRYFIAYIDRKRLSDVAFPFNIGDEVVTWNGKPIEKEVARVRSEMATGEELTDQAMASFLLTRRVGAMGDTVPRDPVVLGIKKKDASNVVNHQLAWDYKRELIDFPNSIIMSVGSFPGVLSPEQQALEWFKAKANRVIPRFHSEEALEQKEENPHMIGAKKSFVPELGTVIWQSEADKAFHAYIYRNEQNKLIGFVRVPSYFMGDLEKNVEEFAELMAKFEQTTDGLVIDQVNNPGGSLFYLYALVSTLAPQAMVTPREHYQITGTDAFEAANLLETLKKVTDEESAQKALGKTVAGYPVTLEFVRLARNFAQFILDQFRAGKTYTDPYWIFGVDYVNPHAKGVYTKPIVLLTNELDFSGGDFFPAILQDNKRVKVLGTRTSGAGGYVVGYMIPNLVGVESIMLTGSHAIRVDGKPIENLGVTPDIEYSLSVKDYQDGFSEYKKAINGAINTEIDQASANPL